MTAEHANATLVRRAYAAQAAGDLDGYLGLLTDDFVLHIPGRSQIAGEYRGRAAMRGHFADIVRLSEGTFRTSVHDVAASDDHVVALVSAQAERDGEIVALPRIHVWHVRNGALSELWLHPVDQDAFDAYWGLANQAG
jgi:ketosteroid isomerase-like protein